MPKVDKKDAFVIDIVDGKSLVDAYKDNIALSPTSKNMDGNAHMLAQSLKLPIEQLLNKQGITLERCNNKLDSLLEAERPLVVDNQIQYVPDSNLQHEALKTAYKLHKVIGAEYLTINAQQNNFSLDTDNIDKLSNVASKMSLLNQSLLDTKDIQDGEIIS